MVAMPPSLATEHRWSPKCERANGMRHNVVLMFDGKSHAINRIRNFDAETITNKSTNDANIEFRNQRWKLFSSFGSGLCRLNPRRKSFFFFFVSFACRLSMDRKKSCAQRELSHRAVVANFPPFHSSIRDYFSTVERTRKMDFFFLACLKVASPEKCVACRFVVVWRRHA